MGMHDIILQGGGEHARVVLDCLLSVGYRVVAIFDPKENDELFGVKQRGVYDPTVEPKAKALVTIGDNNLRKKVSLLTQHQFTSCVHTSVEFSSRAVHGLGCMILHGAIVQAQARIGDHVIINTNASVDHDCKIDDFVHIAPAATLCGSVSVGEGTFIGAGATILPGIKIGEWSIIGAGSVVTKDVPNGVVIVGNPARFIKKTIFR